MSVAPDPAESTQVYELLLKGGPVMWPILGLSIVTISTAIERCFFWIRLLTQESQIVHDVLAAAKYSLQDAGDIAERAQSLPIGRFLLAPLQLRNPSPETFRLAMEAAGDKEFIRMRRGDKLLETVIAISPLLGLLGTVTGLIVTFDNLDIGGGSGTAEASRAASGIGEALLTTAFGMVVAILALLIFRFLVILQARQIQYFMDVGSRLELIYRQYWHEPYLFAPEKSPERDNHQSYDGYAPPIQAGAEPERSSAP